MTESHHAIVITSTDHYNQEVAKAGGLPIMIDFAAVWCPPCQMIKPVYEQLAGQYKGKMVFLKIDVDDQGELSQQFGIECMPTFIVVKDGKAVDKMEGASKPGLESMIKKHVAA